MKTKPVFTKQPDTFTVHHPNETFTISVEVAGYPIPTLQWFKSGFALEGETGKTLTIHSLREGNEGVYFCIATNSEGSRTSTDAVLRVNEAPQVGAWGRRKNLSRRWVNLRIC